MKNIVLIGFMGTGKTTTGKLLSSKLGYSFLDMDKEIAIASKMSIKDIFDKYGEAYFRSLETKLVQNITQKTNMIISTGGGIVKNPANLQQLAKNGLIIALSADIDTVLIRTGKRGVRPILDKKDNGDRRAAIKTLMTERHDLYAIADYTVDTSHLSPMQVVEKIIQYSKNRGVKHA